MHNAELRKIIIKCPIYHRDVTWAKPLAHLPKAVARGASQGVAAP
jgi:hypothetical protein